MGLLSYAQLFCALLGSLNQFLLDFARNFKTIALSTVVRKGIYICTHLPIRKRRKNGKESFYPFGGMWTA